MSSVALVSLLKIVSLLGSALTALKLFKSGLYRRYRVFFAYFVFRLVNGMWPIFLDVKSPKYFYFWVLTEPVLWVFYILMVFELYRLVLENHKGLYTLGRWAMYIGIGLSVIISALSLLPRITPAMPQQSRIIGYFFAAERGIDLSLAIFILLILFFLSRYPVPLSRNVVVHAVVYSIYFLSNTLVFLLKSLFGLRQMDEVNLLLMCASSGCVVAWLVLLTPKGEKTRTSAQRFGPEHEERVLQQLDSLNATLLKVSRN
jgi:hypothetical protein